LAACIETLIDDRALLLGLREIIAIETREALRAGVRKVNVCKLPAGHLLHPALVGLDPIDMTEAGLARHGHDGDVANLTGGGDPQRNGVFGRTLERLLDVHRTQ